MALLRQFHRCASRFRYSFAGFAAAKFDGMCRVKSRSSTSVSNRLGALRHVSCTRPARISAAESDSQFTVAVDRSGLKEHKHEHEAVSGKSKESPLERHIKNVIRFRGGPVTVAEYMSEVLTNPKYGFYMNRDVFGAEGDFVTSPDISQMFGEMVGVWSTCLWQQMGEPDHVNLVELGPGRGTLMADLLRSTAKFTGFSKSLSVHLVECSPALRQRQYQTLDCKAGGSSSASAGSPLKESTSGAVVQEDTVMESDEPQSAISQISGTSVTWHLDLEQVPRGTPTIILAHEFLDALPVHQFQRTERGWCEKLIDVSEDSEFGLRFVLSPDATPATKLYLAPRLKFASEEEKKQIPQVEICPKALKLTHDIAHRVGKDGGGALIIDYGKNQLISDSLQAIRKHQFVHVFEEPGTADLSAFVDFAAVKQTVADSKSGATAFGPITQAQLLGMLGINFRLEALLENASEEQAEALQLGYWRLVGDGHPPWLDDDANESTPSLTGMGPQYMALAVVNQSIGPPAGFQ